MESLLELEYGGTEYGGGVEYNGPSPDADAAIRPEGGPPMFPSEDAEPIVITAPKPSASNEPSKEEKQEMEHPSVEQQAAQAQEQLSDEAGDKGVCVPCSLSRAHGSL